MRKNIGLGALALVFGVLVMLAAACGGSGPKERTIAVVLEDNSMMPGTIVVKHEDTVILQIEPHQTGELHIHGYDIPVDVEAGEMSELRFVASIEGRFNITFHGESGHDGQTPEGGDDGAGEYREIQVGALEVHPR